LEEIFEIQGFMEVNFDLAALLRTEIDLRYGAYQKALQAGWQTINEVRRAEGMPPIPDGDEPYIQSQNRPLSVIAQANDLNPSGTPSGAADPGAPPPDQPPPSSDQPSADGEGDAPSSSGEAFDVDRARKLLQNKLIARGIIHAQGQ
jgi:hypothetical protein